MMLLKAGIGKIWTSFHLLSSVSYINEQGCRMSLWLLNLFINGVVREVKARVLGRGLKLVEGMTMDGS